jgi:hypothetical protein
MQTSQTAPPVPQAPESVPSWHVPVLSQQPFGHDVASHTHWKLRHSAPEAVQFWQTTPPVPQLELSPPVWQLTPLQQPDGHELASQTHAPPEHS